MKLLQNLKGACGVFAVSALLCSCSSAVFPDIIEEDEAVNEPVMSEDSSFVSRKGKKIELSLPEESSSLRADDKNAAYDEDDKELADAMNSSLVKDDEIAAVKTTPVNKEDIKKIKEATGLELECFIHGAMCTSISGRCVLSNYCTNRDANRGGCAQICRWMFDTELSSTPFSMTSKDLNMIPHIKEMIEIGVNSFKVEGSMTGL